MTTQDFMNAAFEGNITVIEQGLESGIEIDTVGDEGWTALCWAANNGDAALVYFLLKRGANVNFQESEEGESVLMLATQQDDDQKMVAVMTLLLEGGATVDLPDYLTWTALIHATEADSIPAIKLLLQYGANPDFKANENEETTCARQSIKSTEAALLFGQPKS